MASMLFDSDDEDLLQPSIATKAWIITPEMVDNVLTVCPDTSGEAIKRDLHRTRSVTTTINRILDGEVASHLSGPDNPSSTKNKTTVSTVDGISSLEDKKAVASLSDTDIDTDTEDSDIVMVKEERQNMFTSLKERLGRPTFNNTDALGKDNKVDIQINMINRDKQSKGFSISKENLSPRKKYKERREKQHVFQMEEKEENSDMKSEKLKTIELRRTDEIQDISFTGEHCEKMEVYQDNDIVLLEDDVQLQSSKPPNNFYKKQQNNNLNTSEIIDLSFVENDTFEEIKSLPSHKKPEVLDMENQSADLELSQISDDFCLRLNSVYNSDTCDVRITDVSASESENEDSFIPAMKQVSGSTNDIMESLEDECHGDENIPKKKKKGNLDEARKQKEEKKLVKEREKQRKKELIEREKSEKQKALLLKKKQKETIEVFMDPEVLSNGTTAAHDAGNLDPIIAKLASLGVSYSIQTQSIPKCITWKRTIVEHKVDEDLELKYQKTYSDEDIVIVRLDIESCISLVDEYKNERSGSSVCHQPSIGPFFSNVTSTFRNKAITVVIVGVEKYFSDIKTRQARQFRNAVRGDADVTKKTKSKSRNPSKNTSIASKVDVEEMLVYLELTTDIKITVCETEEDFAEFVGMFTKALAEAPFKKTQPETFSFCVDPGKKPPVKVTKDGSGFLKLWRQQLQQYHNVSANMSAAIVSVYPSPRLLVQAYRQCADEKSASILLKDIVVRRGEGVLATSRRIGPELSRQIYTLFNATDGQTLTK